MNVSTLLVWSARRTEVLSRNSSRHWTTKPTKAGARARATARATTATATIIINTNIILNNNSSSSSSGSRSTSTSTSRRSSSCSQENIMHSTQIAHHVGSKSRYLRQRHRKNNAPFGREHPPRATGFQQPKGVHHWRGAGVRLQRGHQAGLGQLPVTQDNMRYFFVR